MVLLYTFVVATSAGGINCFADIATPDGPLPAPLTRLVGFTRQRIAAGTCALVSWALPPPAWTAAAAADGALWTQSGRIVISVGGGQPGYGSPEAVLSATANLGPPQALGACGDELELQKAFYGGATI